MKNRAIAHFALCTEVVASNHLRCKKKNADFLHFHIMLIKPQIMVEKNLIGIKIVIFLYRLQSETCIALYFCFAFVWTC